MLGASFVMGFGLFLFTATISGVFCKTLSMMDEDEIRK